MSESVSEADSDSDTIFFETSDSDTDSDTVKGMTSDSDTGSDTRMSANLGHGFGLGQLSDTRVRPLLSITTKVGCVFSMVWVDRRIDFT